MSIKACPQNNTQTYIKCRIIFSSIFVFDGDICLCEVQLTETDTCAVVDPIGSDVTVCLCVHVQHREMLVYVTKAKSMLFNICVPSKHVVVM